MADPFDPRNASVRIIPEATFGVTPAGSTQAIPFQSLSLKQPTDTVISQTIRSGRAPIDLLRVSLRAEANLGFEMIAAAYDDFWEQSLMSTAWSSQVQVSASTLSFAATDDSINDSGGGFGSFAVNQWVHISGFTGTASQNGFYKILTQSTSKLTLAPAITSDDAAGEAVIVTQGPYLEDSNSFRSMAMEVKYDESTAVYKLGLGMSVSEANMTVAVGEIINGSFTLLGTSVTTPPAQIAAPLAATTNKPMNAVDHVARVMELSGANMKDLEILGMDFSVNNNLAVRELVAVLGAAKRHRADLFEASGTIRVYLDGLGQLDRFYDFSTHNIVLILLDGSGNGYVFDWPAIKFSDADDPVQGGQDLIIELPWNAFEHPTENVAMRIARFTSVPS
jgi:hypothetical protein